MCFAVCYNDNVNVSWETEKKNTSDEWLTSKLSFLWGWATATSIRPNPHWLWTPLLPSWSSCPVRDSQPLRFSWMDYTHHFYSGVHFPPLHSTVNSQDLKISAFTWTHVIIRCIWMRVIGSLLYFLLKHFKSNALGQSAQTWEQIFGIQYNTIRPN